jgi:large subunit ribosomal protein L41e
MVSKSFKKGWLFLMTMKRSSRRWKKKRQMRWKWQRKRMKKEKRRRAAQRGG